MKILITWLISLLTDILGPLVIIAMLFGNNDSLRQMHAEGNYVIDFCATAAVVPAILTAIYAAANYELTLSWAVLRWMSPLNVFSGRISHFFLTLILAGASWAMILIIGISYLFPNARFAWIVPFLKGISEDMYNYLFT